MPRMKRPAVAGGLSKFRGTIAIDDYADQTGQTPAEVRGAMSRGEIPFAEIDGQIRVDLSRQQGSDCENDVGSRARARPN